MYLALQSCTPLQLVLLFEKKSLVCICFISETRVPRGALERWVGDEPKLPGGSPACSKALPELGDFRCAPSPPVRSSDRLLFLHPLPPALLSATTLQSARGVTTLHVPRQCSVLWRGSGGAVPWPSLKCAFRACQGLLSAAVACRTIS